jgi:hypothetical protein
MKDKKIIIPNIECMSNEQLQELKDFLDSCPIEYEVWEKEE